jgi:CRP/FNR family transcriptional regulator
MMVVTEPAVDARAGRRICNRCRLRHLCLPLSVSDAEANRLRNSVRRVVPLAAGEHLFHVGDSFSAIYAVQRGCLETYRYSKSGRKQVLGFFLDGEVLGLDAIDSRCHSSHAVALEDSTICAVSYRDLMHIASARPEIRDQLISLLSRQLEDRQALDAGHDARERIASFLMDVARRRSAHGERTDQIVLPMPREDIASRLHIATETVSRTISRLQNEGIIEAKRRSICLLDATRLKEIAEG